MAIVNTISTATQFADQFNRISPNSFTIAALETLFEYYDELSEDMNIEFDPVAIRCDWAEYTDSELWAEFADRYSDELESDDQAPELAELMAEDTIVLPVKQPIGRDTWLVAAY
jgi:hypothetical protein